MKKLLLISLAAVIVGFTMHAFGAAITENDSTQPRGAPTEGTYNGDGQPLDPIVDGFRAPARFDGEITPEEDSKNPYRDWLGSIMANATRDPGFFATLNVANQDFIELIRSLPDSALATFLAINKLDDDVSRDAGGSFQCLSAECLEADSPEDLLPVAADLCLRCHSAVGWLEAHSEPPTSSFPFLNGQFWGAAFLEEPVGAGFDITEESEAEMEGVQCDFCHRAKDNFKRVSLYDGSTMAAGNGGFFVETENPFNGGVPKPEDNEVFQKSGDFCGTCHDVTNPMIKTNTTVNGSIPDMLHPIERTYTEWFWSGYRDEKSCEECHKPMQFVGAQSWLLYPGLDMLWGDVDQKWIDRGILTPPDFTSKTVALMDGAEENRSFMKSCAQIEIVDTPENIVVGQEVTVTVRVTNEAAGHKLPTGYAEGRQMWIHIKAVDNKGNVVFEDGQLDEDGSLVHTPGVTKVYQQKIVAEGYDFLDANDKEFHFVLMNTIIKDNRIPPKGFNKAAYQADGAFIIPEDLYEDGQNWDETPYTFMIPALGNEKVNITAKLYYQTFNKEYIDFLTTHDREPTIENGGRARNLPQNGMFAHDPTMTWSDALETLWQETGNGPPVEMGEATFEIRVDCFIDADCDDGVGCTDETCDAGTCLSTPNDANCPDDGVFCNGTEFCDEALDCSSTGDPCDLDVNCNEGLDTCAPCDIDDDCDDGLYCTGDDTCDEGTCVSSSDPCPDDGLYCNGDETCAEGVDSFSCESTGNPCPPNRRRCSEGAEGPVCRSTTPPPECRADGDCDDENVCTVDTCESGSCENTSVTDGTACDDGGFCTATDTCQAGVCEGTGSPCPGSTTCNEETQSCDCIEDADCDDGTFCNGTETCDPAAGCRPGSNPCTDDGAFCNGDESCDEKNATCVSSGDPCSPDDCNEEADTCEPQESIECSTNALGSAFFLLPGVVIIQGTGTEFTQLGSQVYYDPPVVIPFFKTVNPDGKTITQLVIVLPSILPRVPTYGTTVTVTVDGLTDDIGIGRFPF